MPYGICELDENGSLISKTNIEGELIYKGKNIFGGYAKNYNDLNLFDSILWPYN